MCFQRLGITEYLVRATSKLHFSPSLADYTIHRKTGSRRLKLFLVACTLALVRQPPSTMGLCELCSTVPFTALPRLPQEGREIIAVADNAESTQIMFYARDGGRFSDAQLPDPVGFPFHRDLDALAFSARSCPVCSVAQSGVQGWIERWEDAAKNNKHFIEFSLQHDPIPRGQQLWLTACDDGEQGFCLWAKNPVTPRYLNQLAAVRFYVEPS